MALWTSPAQLLHTSGSVNGVVVRPWLGSSGEFPLTPGFTPTSHRVLWVWVTRYSDILFAGLRAAQVDFAGLICPRKRGEVGLHVPFSCDSRGLCECIQSDFGGKVKIAPAAGRRVTLRANGVPLAMLDKLHLLVAKVDCDLRIVESRVIRTTYDSLVANLVVEGKDLAGDEWRFSDLGMRLVVIKKLLPRRPAPAPAVRVPPVAHLPAPRRPLSGAERVTWAEKARGSGPSPMQVETGGSPSSNGPPLRSRCL